MKPSPLDPPVRISAEETLDLFGSGAIRVIQPKKGYRFSIDTLLLARFVGWKEPSRVLDMGTGCGILPLLLARRFPRSFFFGLELSAPLIDLARRNLLLNEGRERIVLLRGDIRALPAFMRERRFDVVVANPPYRPLATGRINPDPQKALARHELTLTLPDLLRAAAHALKVRGRWFVIYPARRLVTLLWLSRQYRLEPKRLQLVHSFPEKEAEWVLLETVHQGKEELRILPPLILYHRPGSYTPQLREWLQEWGGRNPL